ncbi:GATA-type zinc finger protein 1 [Dipodomys spectabilis]|uniref:GATA-type zinc finger protein 1 n=1 Tax=Dipodomys spectabilis TaxID=105255 RepID=UPI001C53A3C9|nr:GATA-type zinc finger protein 1 [Dipodomys spectabilis]
MEAAADPRLLLLPLLRELLAPPCLDPESPPGPPAPPEPRPLRCRSLWPACQASLLRLLRKAEEELARPPIASAQAPGPCREPMALGSLGPLAMAQGSKNMRRAASPKRRLPEHPQAPSRRRPRKQPHPRQGSQKGDLEFKGVTLKFQMNPDCSFRISPTYSLAGTSLAQKPFPNPARVPEPNHGGNEILEPRRCASCRTQRTPLWRDAEDGTPALQRLWNQIQEIWYPLFQLLAGAQEKCPGQASVWQFLQEKRGQTSSEARVLSATSHSSSQVGEPGLGGAAGPQAPPFSVQPCWAPNKGNARAEVVHCHH